MHVACIRTHLISSASAVSLIPRPEDRTRLLSSSLGSFSGPLSFPSVFYTGMLGGGWERGYLSSCSSSTPCFLLCPGLTQLVLYFGLLFQQRTGCVVTFDSTFLFEARPLFAWVTSRTRLCHIDDRPPKLHFENFNIDYPWP